MVREHIHMKVSIVVELVDDFTNQAILPKAARVWIQGEKRPVVKPEGYFVFHDISVHEVEIHVEAYPYQRRSFFVTKEEWADGICWRRVRLVPGEAYKLPENTTRLTGKVKPGARLELICRSHQKPLRLLRDYTDTDSRTLSLFHSCRWNLEQKKMLIVAEKVYDVFGVVSQEQGDVYTISRSLKHTYDRSKAMIYPVYEIEADDTGSFLVPLPELENKGDIIVCERIEKDKLKKGFEMKYGDLNEYKS